MRVYKWVGVGDCFDAEGKGSGQNRNYAAPCQAFRKHILWKHFAEQTQKLLRTLHCSTILHQSKPPAPLDTARTPTRATNFLLICGNGSFSWVSKNRNSGQNKNIATLQFCTTNWFLSFHYSMVNALLIVSWLLSQGENIFYSWLSLFLVMFLLSASTNTEVAHLRSDVFESQVTEMAFQAREQGRTSLLIT